MSISVFSNLSISSNISDKTLLPVALKYLPPVIAAISCNVFSSITTSSVSVNFAKSLISSTVRQVETTAW